MELNIYVIYDTETERYMAPWLCENDKAAKRMFAHNIEQIDIWKENPEQFELHFVGTFNDTTGRIEGEINNTVCKGTDLIRKE